jgi:hypothetical protein
MYLQEFAASLAFCFDSGSRFEGGKNSGLSPEIQHIPRVRAFRALAEKGLGEPPFGGHSKSQTSRAGEGTNLFFELETSADPWFPCPIVVWLWRGRMIWLAVDVLLHGFLALPDGLLNFLFGGWFLS